MSFLTIEDIYEGSYVLIPGEGWAELIKPYGNWLTFEEDDDRIRVRQRWLIKWLFPAQCENLTKEGTMTQIFLAGKQAHRYIEFIAFDDYKELDEYGYSEQNDSETYDNDKLIDDFNGLF